MKKARKLGLQSLALVLMAFVLVAGVAFGMTGAWFTSGTGATTGAVDFGTVAIDTHGTEFGFYDGAHSVNLAGEEELTEPLMPGDHLDFKLTVNNNGEAAYVLIHMTVSFTDTTNSAAANAFNKYYTVNGSGQAVEFEETITELSSEDAVDVVGSLAKTNGTVTIDRSILLDGTVYGNDYQGAKVTASYEIRAIQARNLTAQVATTLLRGAAGSGLAWTNGASDGKTMA